MKQVDAMFDDTMRSEITERPKFQARAYAGTYIDLAVVAERLWNRLSWGWLFNTHTGSGFLLLLVCAPFILGLERLPIGTLQRIGPGMVPGLVLAVVLLIAGGLLIWGIFGPGIKPRLDELDLDWQGLRGILMISAGVLAFMALLPNVGLVIAAFVTSLISSIARPPFRPLSAVALATFNTAAIWIVFVVLLDLHFRAFPRNMPWMF